MYLHCDFMVVYSLLSMPVCLYIIIVYSFSEITTVNSASGSTLQCHTQLWDHDIKSLGGSTLQCGKWLWDDMTSNSPKRPPYWNSTSGFDFDHITAVDMSFCTSQRNFYPNRTTLSRKKASCRFSRWLISAILDFMGPIMGSLKSHCTTSYRSPIDTIALNCLVFFRKSRFCILATNRQTDKQTNRRTDGQRRCTKPLSLSRAAV